MPSPPFQVSSVWLHSHKASAAVGIWVDIASKIFTAVTTLFSPSKADEFFKFWMQTKTLNGGDRPDDKMYFPNEKSQSEKLEEMGFPEHKKNSSVHPFYFCHAYF
jgi:hypothetical protein